MDNINVVVEANNARKGYTQTYETIVLKPNVHDEVNVLTEEMFTKENAKYVIKWDYDLMGESITIPENCIISMEGGSLTNGTLVGQNTKLINESGDESLIGVNLRGSWKRPDAHVTADEEDLTINNHNQIQLANKVYDEETFSGMGRVYLRKNIMDGKNILDETMMSEPNTVYIIQYDFDLDGEIIEVPENCVLKFEGGSISNGSIDLDNFNATRILGNCKISNLKVNGIYNDITVYPNVQRQTFAYIKSEGEVQDYITASSLYYANQHNCTINLNSKLNTPNRFGAVGDLITDDSEALQCLIDVMYVEEGEIDLTSISNNNAKGYLITKPIVIQAKLIPPGYPVRPRVTKIKSDYCPNSGNDERSAYIKATNIPDKRGALELIGRSNANECTTSIEQLCVDASDKSNSPYSFALVVGDAKYNNFVRCKFRGRNAVMSYCGNTPGAGYAKICVKWDTCIFAPTEKYAVSTGVMFGMGSQQGDNEMFLNCLFQGLVEVAHHGCYFENCMFWNDSSRAITTMGAAGFITANSVHFNTPVEFSTAVAVLSANTGLKLTRCYFEDPLTDIDVIGVRTSTTQYYSMSQVGKITIDTCYFNGLTNHYNGNDRIFANYGIRIRRGFDGHNLSMLIINSTFRDGNKYEIPDRKYFFNYGAIVNESIAERIKVIGNHKVDTGFTDEDDDKFHYYGNIDFGNYTPPLHKEITLVAYTNNFFKFTSSKYIAFGNIKLIIKNISQQEFEQVKSIGFNLFNTFNQLQSKEGDTITYGDDIRAVLNLENDGLLEYDSTLNQAEFNLYKHVPLKVSRVGNSTGIISNCAQAGKEFCLYTYITSTHPLVGKTIEVTLS